MPISKLPLLARRRLGLLALLMVAHLAALLLVLRPGVAPPAPEARAMVVFAVPVPAPVSVVAAPPAWLLPVPVAIAAPVYDLVPPAAMPPGGCAMIAHVEAALRRDAASAAAAEAVPRAARTVANVVTLWNAGWVDAAPLGGARVVEPIRAAVVGAVLSAPSPCRAEPMIGPRLVFVARPGGTGEALLVLAFGSGQWRWNDLVE